MNHRARFSKTVVLSCLAIALFILTGALPGGVLPRAAAQTFATIEEAATNPDFALQGEYMGDSRAAQVIALGNGDFECVLYEGGLPGAGWNRMPPRRIELGADECLQLIASNGMEKIERKSPTLGQTPPSGAVVLFDGTRESLEKSWKPGARISDDGLLMEGATSLATFESYSLHLEFRTPFMPAARGQARGNSGVYHQGRYETQILDSFGLAGKDNEAGGIYTVRDPDLNMCFPPLAWQTYDVDFKAAEFDADGTKLKDAELTVRLNGVLVHQNVPVSTATRAAPVKDSLEPGPIFLQNHGNPVRFRNIWLVPRDLDAERRRPVVPAFERFFASSEPSVLGGHLLMSELACAACHSGAPGRKAIPETAPAEQLKQAPVLSRVGQRVQGRYLYDFISEPHATKPGTTMPDLLSGYSDERRAEIADAISSFLIASTGTAASRPGEPRRLAKGELTFHQIGCVACHDPQREGAAKLSGSVPLVKLHEKYTLDGVTRFLKSPHEVRRSGRMPSFGFDDETATDVATYLLRDGVLADAKPSMVAKFYQGDWDEMPNFDELQPYAEVDTFGLDIAASQRGDSFAATFDTYLLAPRDDTYEFRLASDDGSFLYVDGTLIVDNNGVHPNSTKIAQVELSAGHHQIRVAYFEKSGEETLSLEVAGGGIQRSDIAVLGVIDPNAPTVQVEESAVYEPKPQLADQGREYFQSLGCANCHELELDGQRISSSLASVSLSGATGNAGCLADGVADAGAKASSGKIVPNYDLSPEQRASIQLCLAPEAHTLTWDDTQQVHFRLLQMNCYACHQREQIGGPELARDQYFTTQMKEMGDEGRLPPLLTGVGDKLQDAYLRQTLEQGANNRPYMQVQMPGFGRDTLSELAEQMIRLDRREEIGAIETGDAVAKTKSSGRQLVGEKGLSCIKCHVFDGQGAPGIQAIDLSTMAARLRQDWFHRYLLSPTSYRPGTRMPASFPDGKSALPELYEGDPSKQIEAMWRYLEDGKQARPPIGTETQMIELQAVQRPILYRNFIDGLSPRAIAVGYPAGTNIAWDANRMALTLLWKNAFVDASKHWVGRGPGTQGPLGDEVLSLESNVAIASLEAINTPWPTEPARSLGYRFKGYRLDAAGLPTFRYESDALGVEDLVQPYVAGGEFSMLTRQLRVIATGESEDGKVVLFRAAVGTSIEPAADGWFIIDNRLHVKVTGQPHVVSIAGKQELRVQVDLSPRQAVEIQQQIRW